MIQNSHSKMSLSGLFFANEVIANVLIWPPAKEYLFSSARGALC